MFIFVRPKTIFNFFWRENRKVYKALGDKDRYSRLDAEILWRVFKSDFDVVALRFEKKPIKLIGFVLWKV